MLTMLVLPMLRQRPFRHFMTLLAVATAAGLCTVQLGTAARARLASDLHEKGNRILVLSKRHLTMLAAMPLSLSMAASLEKIQGVTDVTWASIWPAMDPGSGVRYLVFGISDGEWAGVQSFFPVTAADLDAVRADRQGCIMSERLARRLGVSQGQQVTFKTLSLEIPGRIVGLSRGAIWDERVACRYDYLDELNGRKGAVGVFTVKPSSPEAATSLAATIDQTYANSVTPTRSMSESVALNFLGAATGSRLLLTLLLVLAILAAVTSGLSTANSIAMSVRERRRQIATLRAMGFTTGAIMTSTVAEAVIVCSLGSVLGAAAALGIFAGGASFGLPDLTGDVVGVDAALGGALIGPVLGLVASIFPTALAMRVPVVEGLRELV